MNITLKSFIYIDEADDVNCIEQQQSNLSKQTQMNCNDINNSQADNGFSNRQMSNSNKQHQSSNNNQCQVKTVSEFNKSHDATAETTTSAATTSATTTTTIATANSTTATATNLLKKDLKRSDSLRITNSIKGALYLTKKAGVSSGNQLARISESLRDRFLGGRSSKKKSLPTSKPTTTNCANATAATIISTSSAKPTMITATSASSNTSTATTTTSAIKFDSNPVAQDSNDLEETISESRKIVKLLPGKDGKYGFKIREVINQHQHYHKQTSIINHHHHFKRSSSDSTNCNNNSNNNNNNIIDNSGGKSKGHSIIIHNVLPNSPAATSEPRLDEGDQLLKINGVSIDGLSEKEVEILIRNIQKSEDPPDLNLELNSIKFNDCISDDQTLSIASNNIERMSPISNSSNNLKQHGNRQIKTLADSIKELKRRLDKKELIESFDNLSRKNEDESLIESKLSENIDKNRYRDILPYDSTRVQLIDSMTGDYINASFVDMPVPSGIVNKYIATQGPLASTCDDFWQMVWEQNCSLIIMVTPLIESGRVKCHKYWPDEKEEIRYGQILVRNLSEKSKSATIDRTIQLIDVKSGERRITNQIQYKAWPDHEVPEDCSDFLKLVNRVRKHRMSRRDDPIVVHCSAGIGRTGVLILMETAICIMESNEPVFPLQILQEMRQQRAMLIQTSRQFQFVADAICKVYDQKLYKKFKKHKKK